MKKEFFITLIIAFLVLLYRFNVSPPLLNQDESSFANAAYNISQNLHDKHDRFLPLYFETLGSPIIDWKNPFLVYWTAIFIKVLGFSVFSTRLASIVLGLISVVYVYKTVSLLFTSKYVPMLSTISLLLSPLFIIQSRINIDPIAMVAVTSIEIYFLLKYYFSQNKKDLIYAAITSGVNFYTYSPARLYSGLILILGIILLSKKLNIKELFIRLIIPLSINFLFIIPAIYWQLLYPGLITSRYQSMFLPLNFKNLLSGYWTNYFRYFDFSFIFGHGDFDLLHSTGRSGVFLFVLIPVYLIGLLSLYLDKKMKGFRLFLLLMFILYPIGIFITTETYRACRTIVMLNIFPLILAYGWDKISKKSRVLFFCLVVGMIMQSSYVLHDLYYRYPIRTRLSWQYRYQLSVQVEDMLNTSLQNPNKQYYIDSNIYFGDDVLDYYQNILGEKSTNIIFSDDLGVASKSGGVLLTNRINGEAEVPAGNEIISGWEGYYLITNKHEL